MYEVGGIWGLSGPTLSILAVVQILMKQRSISQIKNATDVSLDDFEALLSIPLLSTTSSIEHG